jgi:hypothetical protein
MGGLLCQWAYRLARYRWGDAPLGRWLRLGLLSVAGLAVLGLLPGRWGTASAVLIVFALSVVVDWWAKRQQYVIFIRQQSEPPPSAPLRPQDKVPLRATGFFEVQGKNQTFTELPAFFRTFATREHAVMAWSRPPRWLLIGSWPAEEWGMWYIFFRPEMIREVQAGLLRFGRRAYPALRVIVENEKQARAVYLSFDGEEERRLVWADIIHDGLAGGGS